MPCREPSNHFLLKAVGALTLALLAVGVVSLLPDIKRYVRITMM